jgi:hypothetical protein
MLQGGSYNTSALTERGFRRITIRRSLYNIHILVG